MINGERIDTTPEHPFYSAAGEWIDAADLHVGDVLRRANGVGVVQAVTVVHRSQVMYNLTVAEAHTFFVGQQQWLVHNCKKAPIHHIATNKNTKATHSGGPWTPKFEEIFDEAQMTLEDSLNKLAIPGHKGPHPEGYHQTIYDRLTQAVEGLSGTEYADALKNELSALKNELLDPGSWLNKIVTKR